MDINNEHVIPRGISFSYKTIAMMTKILQRIFIRLF